MYQEKGYNFSLGNPDAVFCQISVPVTYGNSGGPLIDGNGNVLGIISAGYGDKAGYMANLAVKASYLKLLLESDPVLRKLTFKPILVKRSLTEIVRQVKDNVYLIKVSNSEPESSKNNIVTDKSINSIPRPELQDNGNRVSVLNEVKEKHCSGNYEDAVNILPKNCKKTLFGLMLIISELYVILHWDGKMRRFLIMILF